MSTEGHETRRSGWEPEERFSWFPIPDEGELDPRVAELISKQREKLGAPNNVVRSARGRARAWTRLPPVARGAS